MPAPPDLRPDTGSGTGSPHPRVVPHSGKIFDPLLPLLSPERPRPAGTSTPSAAFLSPQSRAFSHHLPLAGCHGRTRRLPPASCENALHSRRGTRLFPFPARSDVPALQTAAGTVVHTRTSSFRGLGVEEGTVLPQNAPSPTTNPLPIPRSTMLSCGRSKLCETRPSARCARLFC